MSVTDSNFVNSVLNSREYFLQENICRLCWTKGASKQYSQWIPCTSKSPLFFKVQNCLNMDLSQDNSEFPKWVCQDCYQKIEQFHEFKEMCQNLNEKLHQILVNGNNISSFTTEIAPTQVKYEKLEHCSDLDLTNTESLESFIDCLQDTENNLEHIINTSKSTNEAIENTERTYTQSGDEPIIVNNLQNIKSCTNNLKRISENSQKTKKTRLRRKKLNNNSKQVKPCIDKDKEPSKATKSISKSSYKAKKCSTYCNICCDNFIDRDTFIQHNSVAHGIEKDGSFKCFGCGKLHRSRKARLGHEAYFCKMLENGYKCSICDRFLPRRGVYEKHMRDHRLNKVVDVPDDNIFKCSKCFKQFIKKGDWKLHMDEHVPKKKYVCETCGRVFSRQDYLKKHNTTHTGDRKYVCPHCGFRTTQKNNLTIHIRKHTDERPYPCDLCPQRCVSSSNLRAHRRRHLGINSFQCSICNKKFGYKMSLKEHIAITHERSQTHPCPHCAAVYARTRGLRRHLLTKHAAEIGKNEPANCTQMSLQRNALYPNQNEDKNVDGNLYPNLNSKSDEEKLNANLNSSNIPHSNISNENNRNQDGNEEFPLKIGVNDKFVCFEKNVDFGMKGTEKVVIIVQE